MSICRRGAYCRRARGTEWRERLFAELGFDTPTAIRIFLNQSISSRKMAGGEAVFAEREKTERREGMPFDVAKPSPNAGTLVTLLDNADILPKTYNNFREIMEEADAEIAEEERREN